MSKKTLTTVNPYTNEEIKEYAIDSLEEINIKLKLANTTYTSWKETAIEERTELLKRLSELLLNNKNTYAELMTNEMGKPINESIAEIEKCAWLIDFYIVNAAEFLSDELIETEASESFVSYDPLGVILGIMPWNYPFWQVIRFAIPTLTAGNTVIVKHAKNVSGCAKALEQLFLDASFPVGTYQAVIAGHDDIEKMIENNIIKAVSLTGSEQAGKAIAKIAGAHLKKCVLELGGNNACIVWEDANLDEYIPTMVKARMQNTGQSCIAAKRFIVVEEVYDAFIKKFELEVGKLQPGKPTDKNTTIGVLATESFAEDIQNQIELSVKKGAKIHLGNFRKGAYLSPTILTHVTPGMPAFEEEIFGPVAAIIKAKDRQQAIDLANNSKYGLGTMLFTESIVEARDMISSIEDGAFFINEMVKSDPRLPFGGTKASGYGRELSIEGIHEFVNKKTIFIK